MLEGGKPVPESLSARLAKLEEAGRRDPKHAAEVTEKTRRIGVALHEAARRYNWHIVKVNLLRDLVARARRVRFYLQEAMRPAEGGHGDVPLPEQEARGRLAKLAVKGAAADVELGPVLGAQGSYRIKARYRMRLDELADETRRWTTEWGEAFFLQREARLLDRPAPADRGLAIMERLASELDQLEGRREALTAAGDCAILWQSRWAILSCSEAGVSAIHGGPFLQGPGAAGGADGIGPWRARSASK